MALRKIDLMHQMFGEVPDKKCGECDHLVTYEQSRKWFKCECYSLSSSESSDFRKKWTACGLFNKPYNERPVMYLVKHASRKNEEVQCEGQLVLDEFAGVKISDCALEKPKDSISTKFNISSR